MEKPRTPQILTFKDAAAWEEWLAGHHTLHEGVMIQMAKKDSGIPSVTHLEALDVALCYGWIDGIRRGLDETYFLQKFTPRRPRSLWSTINIGKVEALMAAGRMKEPGLAAMKAAKADGRWAAAYSGQNLPRCHCQDTRNQKIPAAKNHSPARSRPKIPLELLCSQRLRSLLQFRKKGG